MRNHDDVIAITADMGFSVFEDIEREFPKRFFNTGVTEQATIGMAAGMALSGYKVFVYAQAIFMTLRCFEQVRLDVAYQKANVKIIGTASGFWLNQLGVSHFALEDVGAMRLLPDMSIYAPGDPYEVAWATKKAYEIDGPAYIRLSKPDRQFVHNTSLDASINGVIQIIKGSDGALLAGGNLLALGIEAAKALASRGIHISVYSVPIIKPFPSKPLATIIKKYSNLFTLEEHSIIGGFGSAVSEYITDEKVQGTRLYRFGVPDAFIHITGSREYLLEQSGLSLANIVKIIVRTLKK
jgi:transketolase